MCPKHQKRSNNADIHNLPEGDFAQHILDWLECADDDLESARLLYENKHYSNALYHLQQSVEKATKAFGLGLRLVKSSSDMRKIIGHNPLNVAELGTTEYFDTIDKQPKELQVLNQEIGTSLIEVLSTIYASKLDIPDSEWNQVKQDITTEFRNRSIKGISYLNQKTKQFPKEKELDFYITEMKITTEMLCEISQLINILDEDVQLSDSIKNSAISSLRGIFTSNDIASEDQFDSEVNNNTQIIDFVRKTYLCNFIRLFCLNLCIWGFIVPLSAITRTIEDNTRYPDPIDLYTPLKHYSENHILVMMFEELANYTEHMIESLYEYFELSNVEFKLIRIS